MTQTFEQILSINIYYRSFITQHDLLIAHSRTYVYKIVASQKQAASNAIRRLLIFQKDYLIT